MYNNNNKKKINSIYFNKKNKKISSYIYLILIFIFIFFVFLNMHFKKSSEVTSQNLIKNSKDDNTLPPKPKEKWKYIQKLENL